MIVAYFLLFLVFTLVVGVWNAFPEKGIFRDAHESWVETCPDCAKLTTYIIEKYLDGVAIGLLFIAFAPFDRDGKFMKAIDELLTNLHPVIVLIGAFCTVGYLWINWYSKHPRALKIVSRICKAWFDLVQQFFGIALGAFFPVKIFIAFREHGVKNLFEHLGGNALPFSGILLCTLLFCGIWALKEESVSAQIIAKKRTYFFIFGIFLLLTGWLIAEFLALSDGGVGILKKMGSMHLEPSAQIHHH